METGNFGGKSQVPVKRDQRLVSESLHQVLEESKKIKSFLYPKWYEIKSHSGLDSKRLIFEIPYGNENGIDYFCYSLLLVFES